MADVSRRTYLLAAIQADGQPVTTARAEWLLAASPWPTAGRNTARKDLRALAARGFLAPQDASGRRTYFPTTTREARP
ncbi:hypothetical protein G9272_32315 [Streptomyces asoensis]|uniref:Uncharacterized protein n=1 Tax=Streptomyces asoensis TaxID=249586 RepID=A0A6M4X8E1_9ACTN|nr:hypothetical protein [Streptomyces asoensis]QJT04403.1 hypothetical protein G9272_32315 [Streptomyces asoensis]